MHERTITEGILETVLKHARPAGARRVTAVYLVLGQLSSILDDSVQFYWDSVSQNTPAEGAQLHFRHVPAQLQCLACDRRYAPDEGDLACPSCHSTRVKLVAGDEFYVEAIDVEGVVQAEQTTPQTG